MPAADSERLKIADAPLSVLLLASAGGQNIQGAVRSWLDWLSQRASESELVLVLDAAAESQLSSDDSRLRIVHQVQPCGLGACLQTALWLVRHPLLLTATADRQFQPADAQRLFEHIDQVDLITGYRVKGPPPPWMRIFGFFKRLFTRVVLGYAEAPRAEWLGWTGLGRRCWIRLIYGLKLRDSMCALRLHRTEVVRRIPIQSRGSFALVEVLAKANHLGCLLAEEPAPWTPPPAMEADPFWNADEKLVRRRPDFGEPAAPSSSELRAGIGAGDLIA